MSRNCARKLFRLTFHLISGPNRPTKIRVPLKKWRSISKWITWKWDCRGRMEIVSIANLIEAERKMLVAVPNRAISSEFPRVSIPCIKYKLLWQKLCFLLSRGMSECWGKEMNFLVHCHVVLRSCIGDECCGKIDLFRVQNTTTWQI